MAVSKKRNQSGLRSLHQGRPPFAKDRTASLSSKATRSIIRSQHILNKTLKSKKLEDADLINGSAVQQADLDTYQRASQLGQSSERGGDTSKLLVEWLNSVLKDAAARPRPLRMLEVGSLSSQNTCSTIPNLYIRRIDLKAREPVIEEADFMDLPIPSQEDELFDVVSLSLVLNFVSEPVVRGEMLRRVASFFRPSDSTIFPCLFLVVPLACVENSRYLTETALEEIFSSLGFSPVKTKMTAKLYYSLWQWSGIKPYAKCSFRKQELRSGRNRNNFAIVLE